MSNLKDHERRLVREAVVKEIARTLIEAKAKGLDPTAAARSAFPGVPAGVLAAAEVETWEAEEEAWWGVVENTIPGDVIRAAVVAAAGKKSPDVLHTTCDPFGSDLPF